LQSTLQRWGYEVLAVQDGVEAWQALAGPEPPALAILDWMMPGIDGVQLCRRIRAQVRERYTYVLLLTAKQRKEDVVEGLEAGADDYVVKPFDAQELNVRLRTGVRILNLQADLISARETLQHQATHDPLTGLWNRTAILDTLQRELARACRDGSSVGIVMADLDRMAARSSCWCCPAAARWIWPG
jgi:PleD family two-component response regulator